MLKTKVILLLFEAQRYHIDVNIQTVCARKIELQRAFFTDSKSYWLARNRLIAPTPMYYNELEKDEDISFNPKKIFTRFCQNFKWVAQDFKLL